MVSVCTLCTCAPVLQLLLHLLLCMLYTSELPQVSYNNIEVSMQMFTPFAAALLQLYCYLLQACKEM